MADLICRAQVHKVQTHTDEQHHIAGKITPLRFYANACADALAARGAVLNQRSQGDVQNLQLADNTLWLILSRVIAVTLHCAALDQDPSRYIVPKKKPILPAGGRLEKLLQDTDLYIVKEGKTWRCQNCLVARPLLALSVWLNEGRCIPRQELPDRIGMPKIRSSAQPGSVGKCFAHPSHHISYTRGIFWCRICGNYAAGAPRQLRNQCSGRPTKYGAHSLSRLKRGLFPQQGSSRPAVAVSSVPGLGAQILIQDSLRRMALRLPPSQPEQGPVSQSLHKHQGPPVLLPGDGVLMQMDWGGLDEPFPSTNFMSSSYYRTALVFSALTIFLFMLSHGSLRMVLSFSHGA